MTYRHKAFTYRNRCGLARFETGVPRVLATLSSDPREGLEAEDISVRGDGELCFFSLLLGQAMNLFQPSGIRRM